MTELHKLSSENLLIKAGESVKVFMCAFFHVLLFRLLSVLPFVSCSGCCEQLSLWIVQPASL